MTADLESRIRRLEDRATIGECVIRYATAVDRRDWGMFADCFTDPVHADYSQNGVPAEDFARDELVRIVSEGLSVYAATQHLSLNHVIDFDERDHDRAVCRSYMYAQHLFEEPGIREVLVLKGSYDNHMLRTPSGWRIERIVQHVSWVEGDREPIARARRRQRRGG